MSRVRAHPRVASAEFRQQPPEKRLRRRPDETDPQFALFAGGCPPHASHRVIHPLEKNADLVQQHRTGFGERDGAAIADHEHGTDSVLQFLHRAAQCRLRDMEPARGFGKAQFLGDGLEVAEVAEFHCAHTAPA